MEKDKAKTLEKTLPSFLGDYAQSEPARFHMPGHKVAGIGGYFREELAKWDVAFSSPDILDSSIRLTEEKYNRIYGAKDAFLLTQGVETGIRAMLLSLEKKERVLFYRNVSGAFVDGLILSKLDAVAMMPQTDIKTELIQPPTREDVERDLLKTGASVFFIKSPDNYGFCADLRGISDVCHKNGALLLVDASFGAHFPFSPFYPEGPSTYADIWCHSISATMNALNPAAALFLGNCRVESGQIRNALSLIGTSEPSTVLLSSLDWALYTAGRQDWTAHFKQCELMKESIGSLKNLSVLAKKDLSGAQGRDAAKVVVDVSKRNIKGTEAAAFLKTQGIYAQAADRKHILFQTGPEDNSSWNFRLLKALEKIPKYKTDTSKKLSFVQPGEAVLSVWEAARAKRTSVMLKDAAGRICAKTIESLPYGMLCALPGEVITEEMVDCIERLLSNGIYVRGVFEGKIEVI